DIVVAFLQFLEDFPFRILVFAEFHPGDGARVTGRYWPGPLQRQTEMHERNQPKEKRNTQTVQAGRIKNQSGQRNQEQTKECALNGQFLAVSVPTDELAQEPTEGHGGPK